MAADAPPASGQPLHALLAGRFEPGERERWAHALALACPQCSWHTQPDETTRRLIEVAVVANPAPGALQGLPRLRFIQSLWAGVEKLLADTSLPGHVPIARMVDPAMTQAMAQTALWAVLSLHRGFFAYQAQQGRGLWQQHRQERADEWPVLVLGAGVLGSAVGRAISQAGYGVSHWRSAEGAPQKLRDALPRHRIVVNLLPLTPATEGLLNAALFARLPRGAGLVNLARGAHVVEADLLAALASGQLAHAVLDVFRAEPLPPQHPFWQHPQVTVLPHAAALTDERSAADVVARNLAAWQAGTPFVGLVQRARGY
jgi:glyoxylate/hydroxypyruvate reductase